MDNVHPFPLTQRQTVIVHPDLEYNPPFLVWLFTWCFRQVFAKDVEYDPILTPIALLQTMATYALVLALIAHSFWGCIIALAAWSVAPLFFTLCMGVVLYVLWGCDGWDEGENTYPRAYAA